MRRNSVQFLVAFVLFAACALVVARRIVPVPSPGRLLSPGAAFPPLAVSGWINEPGPTQLDGAVTVVDVWAYWCPDCRHEMPAMVATYEKYQDRGVRFIGLTQEDGAEGVVKTEKAVRDDHAPWPTAYGAGRMMPILGVTSIPTLFVIGRDGRVVWNSDRGGTLNEAIESALAQR